MNNLFVLGYALSLISVGIITLIWCFKSAILLALWRKTKIFFYYHIYVNLHWAVDIKFQIKMLKCCIQNGLDLYNVLSLLIFYFIPVVILVLIFSINSRSFSLIIGAICIPWAIIALIVLYLTNNYYKKSEMYSNGFQNRKYSPNKPHHGILFVQYQDSGKRMFIADCIDILATNFDEFLPYKIYPISNEADFQLAYNNPNICWLWILGHGEKRHLTYIENGEIKFIEYLNYPRKSNLLFIAQLHCNPGSGPSLLEINGLIPDYDISHIRLPFQNRCYIKKKVKEFITQGSAQMNGWDYSSDIPLINPKDDRLGYRKIARNIALGINQLSNPYGYVVSINAKWGSGKTTFINFIEYYLTNLEINGGLIKKIEEKPIIIKYNPWWFTGKEDLLRQFFGQFGLGLSKELKMIKDITRLFGQYIVAISKIPLPYDATMDAIEATFNPEKMDVINLKQKIIRELLPKERKIIIIIDDIDRLNADEIKQLFQVIKSIADFPNVIYLLAFDRNIVEPILDQVQGSTGGKYLEKIVQAPFDLPIPTKNSLNIIFSEKLKEILGEDDREISDRRHWLNVYEGGISELIDTPRHIVRLTNTLRVTYPPIKNEINPIDFVALETIRIFNPHCYELVQKNESLFIGYPSSMWGHQQKEFEEFHLKWLNQIEESQKNGIEKIIKALFPVVSSVLHSQDAIDTTDIHKIRRELRICCPENFSRYFWMTVPEESLSTEEFDKIKEIYGNSRLLSEELLRIANENQLGLKKVDLIMQKLIDNSLSIPISAVREIIFSIYDIFDDILIIEKQRCQTDGIVNAYHRIWLIRLLLSRLGERERLDIIMEVIKLCRSLNSITLDIYSIINDPAQNKLETIGSIPRGDALSILNPQNFNEVKQQIIARIERSAENDDLLKSIRLFNILLIWYDWGDKEKSRLWVLKHLNDESDLLFFIERFTPNIIMFDGSGSRFEITNINFEELQKFIDPLDLEEKIKKFLPKLKSKANLNAIQQKIVERLNRLELDKSKTHQTALRS